MFQWLNFIKKFIVVVYLKKMKESYQNLVKYSGKKLKNIIIYDVLNIIKNFQRMKVIVQK